MSKANTHQVLRHPRGARRLASIHHSISCCVFPSRATCELRAHRQKVFILSAEWNRGLDITLCTDRVECNHGNALPLLELMMHCLNGKETPIARFTAGVVTRNPGHAPEPWQHCHSWWQERHLGTHAPAIVGHGCLQVPAQRAPLHPEQPREMRVMLLIHQFAFSCQSSNTASSAVPPAVNLVTRD